MPATPAWPPSSIPRLFLDQILRQDATITIEGAQAHYLGVVMRLPEGSQLKLFDDRTGEWLAQVTETGRKRVSLRVVCHLRERETVPDLWLLFAPIKRGRIDWLVEKATELGVARLVPVRTQRTVIDRINADRLRAHGIEAAEQCERTALPELAPMTKLDALLASWPPERTLLFADEAGGQPLAQAAVPGPAALLIGPEGGFSDEERARIMAVPQVRAVALGPRILRADTAAIAAISIWMAQSGDWDRHPIR